MENVYKVHLFGKKAEGDLKRPWLEKLAYDLRRISFVVSCASAYHKDNKYFLYP